jgi:hypothetical protein
VGRARLSRTAKADRNPAVRPKVGAEPKGEATDSMAFALSFYFFLRFLPKNRMSSPETTQTLTLQQHPRGILVSLNPLYCI